MSATAQPGATVPGAYAPPVWGPPRGDGGWNPWALVWSLPKPVLIVLTVLAFILFWPVGLAALCFMIGTGRIGGRWGHRHPAMPGAEAEAAGCAWRRGRRKDEVPPSSGNAAFDEYRQDTLRRLEEEQRAFAAFLERLRFAKDKAEFDQFMTDRRSGSPDAGPVAPEPPRG